MQISDFGFSDLKRCLCRIKSHRSAEVSHTASSHDVTFNKWDDIDEHVNTQYDVYRFSILLWELFTERQVPERIEGNYISISYVGQRI